MGDEGYVIDPVGVGLGRGAKGGTRGLFRGGSRAIIQVETKVPGANNAISTARVTMRQR